MILDGDLLAFHRYMSVERHLSVRTATEYCRDIDRFSKWLKVDGKNLNSAKTKRIRRWVTGLMDDGSNKPQSVHRKIAALHAYFKWLVRDGRRKENPVDAVERPKCEKRLPHCASENEIGQFLDAKLKRKNPAHELRDHAMLELMYGSGLRRAEVCSVSIGDFDPESDVLQVIGKGDKQRAVFLSQPSIAAIQAYLATRGPLQASDPMFLTARGNRMTVRQLWVIFRDYRNIVGLTKHVTPHTFRHSYATHMLERGADIVTLKELLGHSSVATTQVYTNVSMQHMRGTFQATHPRAKIA